MEKAGHQYSSDGAQALTCVPLSLLSSSPESVLVHGLAGGLRQRADSTG